MPGPFPGMDPWLEQHWGDVHASIVTYCRDRLQGALPRDLRARMEERVYLEWEEDGEHAGRNVIPDVRILEYPRSGAERSEAVAVLEADPALKVKPFDEDTVERFIEIRDFSTGGRLVTVIEVLSPANKTPGRGRVSYLKKREELHDAEVSLVEIDLLRSGEPIDAIPRTELPEAYHTPYLVTVSREYEGQGGREYEIYKAPLERKLPVIRVPLRPQDTDALLDLQAVLNDAYDRGGYDILDYRKPPKPPLEGLAAEWAERWLREKGLR
jgi:hypothetical protein